MEFSELYTGQEIQAHKGYIWTMKFSPDGQYLASDGEDGVVRIWRVASIDAFSKPLMAEHSLRGSMDRGKFGFSREKSVHSQVVSPDKIFWIEESPIHEFHGHASDVLDVTWSNSNFSPDEPHKVMITSQDSKLRILDGVDIVHKFKSDLLIARNLPFLHRKGLPKFRSQISASFMSTGKHIISVGEDCRVYVWNYNDMCFRASKHTKFVSSSEHFLCEDVSVAIPWLGQGSDQSHSNQYPREDQIERAPRIRDSHRFSLGTWFSIDGSFKCSATWPEENLPIWNTTFAEDELYTYDHQQLFHNGDYHTALPETWGLIIVTGSRNGTIRTIQNYGLPVTL
ncbi:hypothetical protein V6N12_025338 [Hibiscus sabdariffa]|uniref:Uncharacterized protein n=1 Tax=Hibiscus sabdariffa TaxID=183260 RepID=A0ABR2CI85_9ROSI